MKNLCLILLLLLTIAFCSCGSFSSEEDERYSYRKRYQSKDAFGWEYKMQKTIDGFWHWFISLDDVYEGPIYDWKYNSSKSRKSLELSSKLPKLTVGRELLLNPELFL